MAKWKELPDMIPRTEAHAMVAAALTEAARLIHTECWTDFEEGQTASIVLAEQETTKLAIREVLDLIDAPAADALAKMLADARAKGMEEALEDVHEADSLELAQHGQSKIVERVLARAAKLTGDKK